MRGAKIRDLENKINKLERCCDCGKQDGGCCYFEVTRSELEALVNEGSLLKGATYKITDRGDLGLWFEAISENELNPEGVRKMLVPSFYGVSCTPDVNGNVWKGVWHSYIAASLGEFCALEIGDLVIYNGLVWRSLTGLVGDPLSPSDNLVDWELVPKDSFTNQEYIPMVFGVIYDYANDWISRQWDSHNNVFGTPFESEWLQTYGYTLTPHTNPVDATDWNWAKTGQSVLPHFYNNYAIGFYNNIAQGQSSDHAAVFANFLTEGAILNNVVSNWIHNNRIPGNISFNGLGVNADTIMNIAFNANNGSITGVIPSDEINVQYNTNNGDIGIGLYAADISDPIVTK